MTKRTVRISLYTTTSGWKILPVYNARLADLGVTAPLAEAATKAECRELIRDNGWIADKVEATMIDGIPFFDVSAYDSSADKREWMARFK